jgi:DNA-binding SARP family transcriptional activator
MGSAANTRLECDELTVVYQPQPDDCLDVDIFTGYPSDENSVDALIRQVSLYKGELLPGFYEEWVSLERERLRADFERKMGKILNCLLSKERWDEIIEWGERWIAQGGSPEPAYRALMQAHAGLGNLSAAADVYNRCVEALRSELEAEPSPATREIFEQIRKKGTTSSRVTTAVPQSFKLHQPPI